MNDDTVALGDVATIIGGYAFKSVDLGSVGYAVVKIAEIAPPVVNLESCERIAPEKVTGLDRFRLRDRDILMAMTGATTGKAGRLRTSDQAYLNQRVAKLVAKDGPEFDDYVWALVSQPGFDRLVLANAHGSAQPNISTDGIGRVRVPQLSKDDRLRVGQFVQTLDDKIEQNRRTGRKLEALARAVFKAWFVDFEPVKAKAAGATAFPGMPAATFAALPTRLVDSELGPVPEGWAVKPVSEAFEVNPTRRLTKGSIAAYLDMKNMPTSGHAPEAWERRAVGSGMKFTNGDTLVARITPCLENGKTAFVDFLEADEVAWGSTEYIVLRPKPPLPPIFAYCLARTESFREFAIQNMSGTSGRQRVAAAAMDHYRLAVPVEIVAQSFGNWVVPLFNCVRAGMNESRKLTTLRDYLLPRLLSGRVRVGTSVPK